MTSSCEKLIKSDTCSFLITTYTITISHRGRVKHICFSKLSHLWFRKWRFPALSVLRHYLYKILIYWKIVNWTPRNKFQWNFNRNYNIFIQENAFGNVCDTAAILPRPQCITLFSGYMRVESLFCWPLIPKFFVKWWWKTSGHIRTGG